MAGENEALAPDESSGVRQRQARGASCDVILLVEDNVDSRAVYRVILEHGGYEVIEARSGTEGLRYARTHRPALILMDISIPELDGWEVTRILKADSDTRHIPIIALTAHALATDRARAEAIGFDGYLTKPCEPRRVLAEIKHRLEPPAPSQQEPSVGEPSPLDRIADHFGAAAKP